MNSVSSQQSQADLASLQTAVSLFHSGKYPAAMELLERFLPGNPHFFDAAHLKGTIYYQTKHYQQAIAQLQQARGLNPHNAQLLNTLACCYLALNDMPSAIDLYKRALELEPGYAEARKNLHRVLILLAQQYIERDEFASAIHLLDGVLVDDNRNVIATLQMAFAQQHSGHFDNAKTYYENALSLLGVGNQQAIGIQTLRQADNDRAAFTAKALYNLAVVNLTLGDYEDAWQAYCARPSLLQSNEDLFQQKLPTDLTQQSVLVTHDQGLGDEIFFLRYIEELNKRGASSEYLPHPKLQAMLTHSSTVNICNARKDHYDFVIAVGDLPWVLDCKDKIPEPLTLTPEQGRLQEVKQQLAQFGPPPYLGITWRAGISDEDNALATTIRKQFPLANLIEALASFKGTVCVLQRDPDDSELQALSQLKHCCVVDYSDFNDELDKMLCLLSLIDDYIGVSNTNLHLRGSLNLPAGVLVPFPAEWRWQNKGASTDWYKDFVLLRQEGQSWSQVLQNVKSRIDMLVQHG